MARRSDHSREELKALAIQAAVTILEEDGAGGLSTRKIAARIGYTVGTLYHVFHNLDDLILHVNAETLDALQQHMQQAVERCRDPYACLAGLGAAYWQFARQHTERWSLLFSHRLPAGEHPPEWFDRRVTAVHARVEEAVTRYAPHLDKAAVVEAARTLWGGVHGICVLALSDKFGNAQAVDAETLLSNLFAHYLGGLAGAAIDSGEH